MSELKKDSVERTLCIPLWSRAIAVKKLPQILPDHDAVRILKEMGETKPPTILYNLECCALAGAIRQYDFAREIREYLKDHPQATIVELGAGLSCLRRQLKNETSPWVNVDFPDVITCSYLEGYPVEGVRYSWLTKQYIKSKRDKFFVVHAAFSKEYPKAPRAEPCGYMSLLSRSSRSGYPVPVFAADWNLDLRGASFAAGKCDIYFGGTGLAKSWQRFGKAVAQNWQKKWQSFADDMQKKRDRIVPSQSGTCDTPLLRRRRFALPFLRKEVAKMVKQFEKKRNLQTAYWSLVAAVSAMVISISPVFADTIWQRFSNIFCANACNCPAHPV